METPEFGNAVHPRLEAEQAIEKFESIIQEVQMAAEVWELKFIEAQAQNLTAEQIAQYANDAIEDLDSMWGDYMGERFLVTGKWVVPQVDLAGEQQADGAVSSVHGFVLSESEEEVFNTYTSYGFGLREINGKPRFGFVFPTEPQNYTIPYLNASFFSRAFAVPEEVSLTLIASPDEQAGITHKERVIESLELYDRLVQMCFSREEFMNLTHSNQKKVIHNLVKEANELITAPGYGIYLECVTSDVYSRIESSTAYGFAHLDSAEIKNNKGQPIEIEGVVLGVGVLEQQILEEKPLRNEEEFIDRSAGICLIVEMHNDFGTHTLYIPYISAVIEDGGINIFPN